MTDCVLGARVSVVALFPNHPTARRVLRSDRELTYRQGIFCDVINAWSWEGRRGLILDHLRPKERQDLQYLWAENTCKVAKRKAHQLT